MASVAHPIAAPIRPTRGNHASDADGIELVEAGIPTAMETDGATSSSSSTPRPTIDALEQHEIERIPLAGADGLFPGNTPMTRLLAHFNCGLQDLRLLFMLLPCAAILLFVAHQTAAGIAVVSVTFLLMCLIAYRLLLLVRARNAAYARLSPREANGQRRGGAMAYVAALQYQRMLSHVNPTAMRLAMVDRDFTPNDYDMLMSLDDEHRAQTFTGLPASAIQRLPTFTVPKAKDPADATKAEPCSICLEPKVEGETVRALICMHVFHLSCIDPWLRESTKCPVCRLPAAEMRQIV